MKHALKTILSLITALLLASLAALDAADVNQALVSGASRTPQPGAEMEAQRERGKGVIGQRLAEKYLQLISAKESKK